MGCTTDIEQEKSIDALYLCRKDNGSSHIVFKLDKNAVNWINRVVVIPTPWTIIDQVNQIGAPEKQPDGIQSTNMDEKFTIHVLDLNCANNDDSNASDKSFDNDKEYQK